MSKVKSILAVYPVVSSIKTV